MAWISENEERKQKISIAFTGEKHPNWQGGVSRGYGSYRGENWKTQRLKALKRDGFKCLECGMNNDEHMEKYGNGLHVNHIHPFHNFTDYRKANVLSNLETLCVSHHMQKEDRSNIQMCFDLSGDDKHCKRRVGNVRGEKVHTSKLTEYDVRNIRKMYDYGLTINEIHLEYGYVLKKTVWSVATRQTWKHIQ
jgi:hypothetical protein